MRFATILNSNTPRVIAAKADETPRLLYFTSMDAVIAANAAQHEEAYQKGTEIPSIGWRWLAPTPRPSKVVCIGLNYMDHCREQNITPPERPLIFAKFPSSIIGNGDIIGWDPSITAKVDYEAELAVVIGKEARLVSEENALDYVFGYMNANDVSARDLQFGDGQWTRGKSLDSFCPLGPWLVTADEIPDPQNLRIRCTVNGQILQESNTKEMIFSVRQLISFASRAFTLLPGDVILTGTPAGVGAFRNPPTFLGDKSLVVVEVEKLGRLENICRELTFRVK